MDLIYYGPLFRSAIPVKDQKRFVRANTKRGLGSINKQNQRENWKKTVQKFQSGNKVGFGSKGDMDNAHVCQLHYKIACVHHERPNFYKSIYVVLKILDKDPHSSNVGQDTLGIHQRLEWYSKYGSSCLALPHKMVNTCVWLTYQCMERYSENLQINSSFTNLSLLHNFAE